MDEQLDSPDASAWTSVCQLHTVGSLAAGSCLQRRGGCLLRAPDWEGENGIQN